MSVEDSSNMKCEGRDCSKEAAYIATFSDGHTMNVCNTHKLALFMANVEGLKKI